MFDLHPDLASCWKEIIAERAEVKVKKTLPEKYPNEGNCILTATELNPELLRLLYETAKSGDICQPGSGRSGLSRVGGNLSTQFLMKRKILLLL